MIESVQTIVIKKDGSKEMFDRNKLLSGLLKACQKRPVNAEEIVAEIENEIQNSLMNEITTEEIGELVMKHLKLRDEVAYVRFASVYREFKDIETFLSELKQLMKSPTPVLVEKEPIGPIKKLCFVSTQISGLVLQEEPVV